MYDAAPVHVKDACCRVACHSQTKLRGQCPALQHDVHVATRYELRDDGCEGVFAWYAQEQGRSSD